MILSKFFKNHLTIPQAINLFEEIKSQTHPDIADLKRLVNFHKAPIGTKDELQALDLKYRAIITIPTTIEKTMSPYQLYASNSPLWAVELTARGIERFINWEKYNSKLPKILFDNYYNNAKQGLYFDDNIDMASYYPTIITDLMKGT